MKVTEICYFTSDPKSTHDSHATSSLQDIFRGPRGDVGGAVM